MDLPAFGHTLRLRRQEQDKTLAEVGRAAGCTRQNVHKVERALSNPTLHTLQRIAEALSLRVELSLVEEDTPAWDTASPDLLQRVHLESRLHRIARRVPTDQLDTLEAELRMLEARLLPAGSEADRARTETLASLLREAGIDAAVATEIAAAVPDKPTSWDRCPERFAQIYDEARRRMAS